MAAGQIAAEDEYLVRPEFRDEIRRKVRSGDVMVGSHGTKRMGLLILSKAVFLPQGRSSLTILMREEILPARAEIDVPAPEATE